MFDLNSLKPEVGELELLHPSTLIPLVAEDGTPVVIRIVGIDSPQYAEAMDKLTERRRVRTQAGREMTPQEAREEDALTLAACTVGWQGLAFGEAEYTYNAENAKRLYLNPEFNWLKEQVNRFAAARRNFIKA
ncbi:MAG: hypothetical protein Q8N51_00905 [Gammaproteobacteria bacterium]|nr:hypothetical protein [Gammaproteobacteria bacterium]